MTTSNLSTPSGLTASWTFRCAATHSSTTVSVSVEAVSWFDARDAARVKACRLLGCAAGQADCVSGPYVAKGGER
jgi:hypothetical protein